MTVREIIKVSHPTHLPFGLSTSGLPTFGRSIGPFDALKIWSSSKDPIKPDVNRPDVGCWHEHQKTCRRWKKSKHLQSSLTWSLFRSSLNCFSLSSNVFRAFSLALYRRASCRRASSMNLTFCFSSDSSASRRLREWVKEQRVNQN